MTARRGAARILHDIEAKHGMPLRAMVEISDRCNEVCVHCYQEQGLKGEMTTEQIKGVLDELADMGVLFLTFSGGEATLRPDFLELLQYARKRGFAVKLFTNGLTMTEDLAQNLAELAVYMVEISLYSHRAEVHDFVTGVPRSFERTVAGIRHLVARGVNVHVKTPLMSINEAEVEDYAAFVDALGASRGLDHAVLQAREGLDREPHRFTRGPEQVERLSRLFEPEPRQLPSDDKLDRPPCRAAHNVHVEPNGVLRPCPVLEVDLGHALEDGVVNSRRRNSAYAGLRSLTWRDIRGCRECDLRLYCGRCHASSLAEVGDALAPYPSACSTARSSYALVHGRAPRVSSRRGIDPDLGPYKCTSDGTYEAYRVESTRADDELAARLGWTRRAGGAAPAPVSRALPGELVQIRRPGQKRSRPERIPSSGGAARRPSATEPIEPGARAPLSGEA